jgi:simple sugar transport system ATP-binding protein
MKKAVAQILLDEGYIRNFQLIDDGTQGIIRVALKYNAGKEKVITGLRRPGAGQITLNGRDIGRLSVRKRYEAGVAYISDDRQNDGLLMGMSVCENLMLREYRRAPFSRGGVLDHRAAVNNAETKMDTYQIRASGKTGAQTPVGLLSGGNQQKLVIARELSENAALIVACQPTRGLDIGATEFVRSLLVRERNAGKSVVLISADLEEIMALSDRIAVLFSGTVAGVLDRAEATVQRVGLLMGGITGKERA